jgi:hypothetical protein
MPTFRHGRNTVFQVQDSGGTERDLSPTLREVNFPRTLDTVETTAFTQAATPAKTYVVGFVDSTFTVSGMFDATATTGPDLVLNGIYGMATERTFTYGPEGSASGRVKYTGTLFLTNYEITGGVGDMVGFSATFQITGAVTRATFP